MSLEVIAGRFKEYPHFISRGQSRERLHYWRLRLDSLGLKFGDCEYLGFFIYRYHDSRKIKLVVEPFKLERRENGSNNRIFGRVGEHYTLAILPKQRVNKLTKHVWRRDVEPNITVDVLQFLVARLTDQQY